MEYVANAFSLNMIAAFPAQPLIQEITLDDARLALTSGSYDGGDFTCVSLRGGIACAVGHPDTAALVDAALGLHFTPTSPWAEQPAGVYTTHNRATVSLVPGDTLYVAQYIGPRLPEGTTALPEGASIRWFRVIMPAQSA